MGSDLMHSPTGGSEAPAVIELHPGDDRASLGYRLDSAPDGRVVLLLPWDLTLLSRGLDFELLRREARRRQMEVAVVSPDPERRQLARGFGFAAFPTVETARAAERWKERGRQPAAPPPKPWWDPGIDLQRRQGRTWPGWLRWMGEGARLGVFIAVTLVLAATAYTIIPEAEITLVPAGTTVTVSMRVAVDPEVDAPQYLGGEDGAGASGGVAGVVPTRRVGLEVEGTSEVEATGTETVAVGRTTGEVLLISLLAQDYVVPAGTIVRTSSTSYPIRFRTTADVVIPAGGQGRVSVEALDERTGNVGALQINRVEGVVGSAVRVINPEATKGAEPTDIPIVTQADYERVHNRLTQQLLDQVHHELHVLLEADEFLPRQSLRVESVPKKVYSRYVGEQSETVSLNLRLLVSGQAIDAAQLREVAHQGLVGQLPPGERLVGADFDIGALRVEEDGPGWFTVDVTGRGYAAAEIDTGEVAARIRGQRVPEAQTVLLAEYPLEEPPQFVIWPEWPEQLRWLERVPLLPMRTEVRVAPRGSLTAVDW